MIVTIILLFAITLIHFYWALGGVWGIDKALPTDNKGNKLLNPPQPLSALVGLMIFGFAYIAYKLWQGSSESIILYGGWGVSIIFLLRVIGDFHMVGLFKKIKDTPFAKYDTWFYIPLCLYIGLSFVFTLLEI